MGMLDAGINQAVITLGGKGTRLNEITKGLPKPLFPILGKSTLQRTIEILIRDGINNLIFLTGFKTNLFIKEAEIFRKKYNLKIDIHSEESVKGEAGSLLDVIDKLRDSFLFINGDIIFDIDIKRFIGFHQTNKADITITTHLTNHPQDSDCIIEKPSLGIFEFKLKNESSSKKGFFLGNAGISIISKKVILSIKKQIKSNTLELSLFRDVVIYAHKNKFKVFSYNTSEYLKDMGTPERLLNVKKDLEKNIVGQKSYINSQKALFLDRDNTIIRCPEGEYITDINKINLIINRVKKIKKISEDFDLVLIISNQPQIAMRKISWQDVIRINGEIISRSQVFGLSISAAYICPHHPHDNFEDEISELKVSCFCRKPLPGLFLEAAFQRNIDLENSLMIGDSWRDKLAAERANINFLHTDEIDDSCIE